MLEVLAVYCLLFYILMGWGGIPFGVALGCIHWFAKWVDKQ